MFKISLTNIPKSNFNHKLILENRKDLKLSGVNELGGFDDKHITVFTNSNKLLINGQNLKIVKLSVDTGELEVFGKIFSIIYSDRKEFSSKNLITKFFGKK